MDAKGNDRGAVVVGFDGSAHAEAALRHAVGEGALRGLPVRVVVAHEPPDAWAVSYGVPLLPDGGEHRRHVEDAARDRVEEVRATMDGTLREVPVEVRAITGSATAVLVQEAQGATLLVVGHRGHGGLRSTLLGSVGLSAILHAPCPVTVVPPAAAEARSDAATTAEGAAPAGGPLPVGPTA